MQVALDSLQAILAHVRLTNLASLSIPQIPRDVRMAVATGHFCICDKGAEFNPEFTLPDARACASAQASISGEDDRRECLGRFGNYVL